MALLALLAVCPAAGAQEPPEAFVIRVEKVINEARAKAVQRNIELAERSGAKTIIIELDTPGGTLDASRELGDFIFTKDNLDIVAYVNKEAFSGGTIVALACKAIYIDERLGTIGDVAPVKPTGEIIGEKMQTVVRESMLKYARERGYPQALVKAMVTKEIEVFRLQLQDEPEGVYQYVEGTMLETWTDEERAKIVKQDLLVPAGQLLTMGTEQALEYGFAKQAVANREALYEALGVDAGKVRELRLTASERLLALVDTFSPLLIVAGIVLVFMELNHPGFGLPGLLGLTCFAAFFLIKWTLQYAHMLELVLFALGLVLLLLEFLVIPGFGLAGIVGIVLVFISLVLAFQGFTLPGTSDQAHDFQINIVTVLGVFAASGVGIAVLARYLSSLPVLRHIMHVHDLAAAHVGEIGEAHTPGLAGMVGQVGIALTPLHPAGRAEFGERLLDVVTEGDFVAKGARIRILAVQGARVVVEPHQEG